MESFVSLKGLKVEEVASQITRSLCEVEQIETPQVPWQKVVVGRLLEVEPHPEADKLRVAQVDAGTGETLNIVCGAPNIAVGQTVPVALIGGRLPGEDGKDFKIKKSKIRGVPSQGMLCSQRELGLGDDHEGIVQLDGDLIIGQALEETLQGGGPVLIIDNKDLTHRADCWGFLGLARELGIVCNRDFVTYESVETTAIPDLPSLANVIEAPEACTNYQLIKVSGIKVGPSPDEWVKRLESAGLNSINNVVDATNLSMLETAQPLHAFDASLIKGDGLTVRFAREDESLVTLDGVKRTLDSQDLIIADSQAPLALAGIMGGEGSGVQDSTTTLCLEGANFHAGAIRRSSLRHGLRSDSSSRFEKGLPSYLIEKGLTRCLFYLSETCPDMKIESGLGETPKQADRQIDFDLQAGLARLDHSLQADEALNLLEALGCQLKDKGAHVTVTLPPWRPAGDLDIPEDLIEEVGRLKGYDTVPLRRPLFEARPAQLAASRLPERRVRTILSDRLGLNECLTYSFIDDDLASKLGMESPIRLHKGVQEGLNTMRTSLAAGLLQVLFTNHREHEHFACYEAGRVYLKGEDSLPDQPRFVGAIHREGESSFHSGKRALEALVREWRLPRFSWIDDTEPRVWAHPGRAACLVVPHKTPLVLARLAEVHPRLLDEEGVLGRVALWEMNLDLLDSLNGTPIAFKELPRFPGVRRDLALVVDESARAGDVEEVIRKGRKHLKKVELFDIYRGKGIDDNQKSLAYHLFWQDPGSTLTDEIIDKEMTRLLSDLEAQGYKRR